MQNAIFMVVDDKKCIHFASIGWAGNL